MKTPPSNIIVSTAFKEAWKGFKGWWIPLCLIASVLFFTKFLPEIVIKEFQESHIIDSYKQEFNTFYNKVTTEFKVLGPYARFIENISTLNSKPETQRLFKKIIIFFGIFFIFVCFLHVIIILMSKFSVSKDKVKIKNQVGKPITTTPSYILLVIIKLIPFFFFIIPGVFLYVKFYFTGFIITEKSPNPFKAMVKSWKLTEGIFGPTLGIYIITLIIDVLSLITVIGFIPATSFKYTLRASLYKQALERLASNVDESRNAERET